MERTPVPGGRLTASSGNSDWSTAARERPRAGQSSARRPGGARRAAGPESRVGRVGYGGALGWTVAGAYVPGLGLIRAGRRVAGVLALALAAAAAAAAVYLVLHPQTALAYAASPRFLRWAAMACVVLAFAWGALAVVTYWLLSPRHLSALQRLTAGLVIAALVFSVSAPLSVAARYAVSQANLVSTVFAGEDEPVSVTAPTFSPGTATDPWANTDRVNILFLGYDRGMGRDEDEGGLTDSIMVASIDAKTGGTVLTSLPRNTARMPFPADSPLSEAFPYGWYNGYDSDDLEWMLNTMYRNLPALVDPDIIGPTRDLGADALKLSVGEALGLHIDYYVLVNIDGAIDLVDAIGGITVNVNKQLPLDGGYYLEPGPDQHLNGWDAIQYARTRKADDDYHRMARQRCVINAVIKQSDFATLLTRYEAVAAAGSNLIRTDVPATMLPALLQLALRVKNGTITSLQFGGQGDFEFDSSNPDFQMMRQRMSDAVAAAAAPADPGSGTTEAGEGQPEDPADPGQNPPPSAGEAVNLDDACAYNPE